MLDGRTGKRISSSSSSLMWLASYRLFVGIARARSFLLRQRQKIRRKRWLVLPKKEISFPSLFDRNREKETPPRRRHIEDVLSDRQVIDLFDYVRWYSIRTNQFLFIFPSTKVKKFSLDKSSLPVPSVSILFRRRGQTLTEDCSKRENQSQGYIRTHHGSWEQLFDFYIRYFLTVRKSSISDWFFLSLSRYASNEEEKKKFYSTQNDNTDRFFTTEVRLLGFCMCVNK